MNLLGLIFLPIRFIFNVLFVFELNFLLGLVGFVLGLFFGLVAGYFAFIYSIPLTVEEPVIPKLSEGDGSVNRKVLKHVTPEMPIWVRNPDYDRVDWINRFVTELWPHLDKAVGSLVTAQVTPLIEQYKPKQIESIEFEALSLGTLPPAITGVKVYDTTDDEVILEPILKWAGNPNVIVAAKAFGLKATVQLVDLTVFATVRITMKPLVPVFPCFSRMTVSLMYKPTIDFGLKLLGGDLMAIPGLYNFAQETIKDALCDMMLWPKSYEVYKETDPTSLKRSVGKLFVRNIRCRNLKDNQKLGTSDPYVYGTMGDKLGNKHTEVQENNLNPDFGEELHLLVRDPAVQAVQLHVMHKSKKKQDVDMGVVSVPIKELKEHEPREFALDITKTSTDANADQVANTADSAPATPPGENLGTMYFELMYRPFEPNEEGSLDTATPAEETFPPDVPIGGGKLKVTVHNGEALAGKSTPNPYVKVQFRGEERKTHVVKKERDPDFEDPPFEFYSKVPPSRDTLHVSVFSKTSGLHHYVSSKESLGYVDIPLGDVVSNGRINDVYQLTESRTGRLKIEIEWIEKKPGKEVPPTPEAMQQQQQQQQQQQMGADAATQQQQQPNAPPQQQAAPPPPQHPAPPPPMMQQQQQQQQQQQYNAFANPAAGGPPGFQQQGMGGPTINVTSEPNRQPFANPTAQPTSHGTVPPQSPPKSPRGFLGSVLGHHHKSHHRK